MILFIIFGEGNELLLCKQGEKEIFIFTIFVLPDLAKVSITIKSGKFLPLCIRIIFLYHRNVLQVGITAHGFFVFGSP